ncbi:PREDICTED: uncharacterized protein LOC104599359 [Nelumbo nucifera]|uniref:Uncharacterized protein LOC104599359 n=1 Tax=Nelumbo nucifera TaxID=4432 RepID=A0A1U7ZZY1_NELNU|nr:PREDICTED: uncharacterized protein LOC104599359 [Nelumbo nucifera]
MEDDLDVSVTRAGETPNNNDGNVINGIGTGKEANAGSNNGDPLFLQNSDHPSMILVSSPLTENNYLTWSRSMKVAFGAKVKLGFINGSCKAPEPDSPTFEQWTRVDCMVTSWILNSISKDIVDAFLYSTSARDLWLELEERFGDSNGPLQYHLQRDISTISQGNLTMAQYYTKLKKLWDELASKRMCDITSSNRLMQFLMGLNDSFDHIKNQILLMDPLPTVNKAYSLVLRVKKQRDVHIAFAETVDGNAMLARSQNYRKDGTGRCATRKPPGYGRSELQKQDYDKTEYRHCDHCNRDGHTKESCFKIYDYPDWYKDLREQKGNTQGRGREGFSGRFMTTPIGTRWSYLDTYAGMKVQYAFNSKDSTLAVLDVGTWIVDTGASNHMCTDLKLLSQPKPITQIIPIHLPDGTIKFVQHIGHVKLSPDLILTNTLHIPSFKFNLLSVSKLVIINNIKCTFYPTYCLQQDLQNEKILAVGKMIKNLYILDKSSFSADRIQSFVCNKEFAQNACNRTFQAATCNKSHFFNKTSIPGLVLWHNGLGHASVTALQHLDFCPTNASLPICEIYHLAKQQRLPFPVSKIRSKSIIDLMHLDLWGPYKHPSITSAHYVFTLVDDFNRSTWIFLLNHKSMTPHKDKFAPRALKCIFLGYSLGQKAYSLYDLNDRKLFTSRDVIFHEDIFPYRSFSAKPSTCPLPIVDPISDYDFPVSSTIPTPNSTTTVDYVPQIESDPVLSTPVDTSPTPVLFPPSTHSTNPSSLTLPTLPHLRQSTRIKNKPVWFKDFVTN